MSNQLLETVLQTCFTKHQALNKLEELKEAKEKKNYADEIRKMESLVIFTSFPLPKDQIPILGNFVRKTLPKIKFIDLKVDPTLIGGACISWQGEYRDYSLRKAISR